jgi:sodium/proline symporter
VTSTTIIAVLVVYLIVLLVIGAWGSRASSSVAGYYVAGKKLPSWVIAFSSNSTGESAWLLLGLTGMGYAVGIHALWIVFGEVLGVALGWVFVALPFKEYTDRYDSITVPDYLESRFGDTQHLFRLASVVIISTMVTAYTAAQLTASGKAFSSFLGTSYTVGVLIGAAVILYYTSVGGFKAVAYSDLLQGVLMFGGLLLLPIVGISAAGGFSNVMAGLESIDPRLLLPMGEHGFTLRGVIGAASFMGIGLAFLGAPQLAVRFMAARSRDDIVQGSLLAVICIVVYDTGAVFAGMAGRYLFPNLTDPETILPTMSAELFPPVFTGIFLVIVLAAIMSTVDSLLILASSAIVRDVVQKIFHPNLSDRRLSFYGKLATVVIGVAGVFFAIGGSRMIFWFVLFAWSGLASAFTPVILCSLFWKGTTRVGAFAGMLAGFVTAVLWVVSFKQYIYDLYEMIPGFAVGMLVTVVVSLFTKPPADAAEEHDAVWRAVGHPFRAPPSR